MITSQMGKIQYKYGQRTRPSDFHVGVPQQSRPCSSGCEEGLDEIRGPADVLSGQTRWKGVASETEAGNKSSELEEPGRELIQAFCDSFETWSCNP